MEVSMKVSQIVTAGAVRRTAGCSVTPGPGD